MPRVGKSMDRKRHLRRTARELAELSKPTDIELRAQHTCMKTMTSTACTACNRGVPYPHPTTAEIEASIRGDEPAPNVDLTDAQISTDRPG